MQSVRTSQSSESVYAYRPALDGVRAFAVIAVILFHGGVSFLPGGFLGVDAFFVLSGFLITSLLLAERQRRGRIKLTAFWGRRARRLLPALLLMLVTVLLLSRWLLDPIDLGLLRGDAIAALIYLANWRMIYRGANYFAQTSTPSALQHTWSLGIEEQFYLVWPVLIAAMVEGLRWRRARPVLLTVCVLGALASAVAAALLYRPADVNRDYFGTDTRAEALLVGAALAVLLAKIEVSRRPDPPRPQTGTVYGRRRPTPSTWHPILATMALVGALGIGYLWSHATGTSAWLYRGGFMFGALCVAAIIAHAVLSPTSPTARILSVAPLVWIGKISYGLYLWHWPLFQFIDAEHTGLTGLPLLGLRVAATFAAATVSYYVLELPIRRRRILSGRPAPTRAGQEAPTTAGQAAPTTAGQLAPTPAGQAPPTAAGHPGPPARRPVPASAGRNRLRRLAPLTATVTAMACTAVLALVVTAPASSAGRTLAGAPVVIPSMTARPHSASPSALPPPMQRPGRKPGSQPRVDFFGDSVSWTLGTYLPPHPGMVVHVRAIEGCGITVLNDILELGTPHHLYPYCPHWPGRWRYGVINDDPDVSVILLNRWELMDAMLSGSYQHVGQPAFDAYLTGQLDEAIQIAGSRGARVVLLTAAYTHRAETPSGGLYPEDQPSRVDAWNRLLRAEVAKNPQKVMLIDLNKKVCPNGTFTWSVDGIRIRSDGLHFTTAGDQQIIAPWLLPQLASIAQTGSP